MSRRREIVSISIVQRLRNLGVLVLLGVILSCVCLRSAQAHKDDYIDETLVFLTLERGELEPEYWLDYGRRGDEAVNFLRHNVSLEYGVTDHWMVDGRVTAVHDLGDGFDFDSARLETRYRFLDEGTLPVDVAVSAEINTGPESEGHSGGQVLGIEPRLILSRDFGELNLTLNLADEIHPRTGESSANASLGLRFNLSEGVRIGAELKYDVRSHEGGVIPQIWFVFAHEVALKFGFSAGFAESHENFGRVAIEVGL
jgi:hypothetical protein